MKTSLIRYDGSGCTRLVVRRDHNFACPVSSLVPRSEDVRGTTGGGTLGVDGNVGVGALDETTTTTATATATSHRDGVVPSHPTRLHHQPINHQPSQ
jgi:hypothetical protein